MSQFTLGRIGIDGSAAGDGTTLQHPYEWTQSGTSVTLSGLHVAASDDQAALMVNNIDSFDPTSEPYEPVVAVTSSSAPTLNGWYRVMGASATLGRGSIGGTRHVSWSATLRRMPMSTQIEATTQYGALLSGPTDATLNAAGDANGAICGFPNAAVDVDCGDSTRRTKAAVTRTTEDGASVRIAYGGSFLPGTLYHAWTVDPASAYVGSCRVKGTYGSTSGLLFLGHALQPEVDTNFELSNGLIRAKLNASGALIIQAWDSGSWVTVGPATWTITGTISASTFSWAATSTSVITIIANSPERCTVRIVGDQISAGGTRRGRLWVDLTVKRGSRVVQIDLNTDFSPSWSIAPSSNSASTTSTNYARQTTADASGNRWVVAATGTLTFNTTTGAVTNASTVTTGYWAIGSEIDGASATGPNTAQAVAYEFFAGRGESARVVIR